MAEPGSDEMKEAMEKAEISIILDTYDDIFSDFDPRPYNERALSEDFILETKRAARDKDSGIGLHLLIPQAVRSEKSEALIRVRLREYFRKSHRKLVTELSARNRGAAELIVAGAVIGAIDALLLSSGSFSTIIKDSVEIILTPASWYTIWTGFDNLLMKPKDIVADLEFYKKMMGAQVAFTPY